MLLGIPGVTYAKYQTLDSVAAVVNNDVITMHELDERLSEFKTRVSHNNQQNLPPVKTLRKQLLEHMINERLQLQLAEQFGMSVTKEQVDVAIENLAQRKGQSVASYKKALEEEGYSFKSFQKEIGRELLVTEVQQREVGHRIQVNNNELKNVIEELEKANKANVDYDLQHILIATSENPSSEEVQAAKVNAEKIMRKLRAGQDFASLAMSESQGQQALKGGELGWRKINELPTLFVKAVKKMDVGEVRGPFHSASGFHIIRLKDRREDESSKHIVTKVHLRQILIRPNPSMSSNDARKKLQDIRERIKRGESFSSLAKAYSDDMNSASKGGDMGWILPEEMGGVLAMTMSSLDKRQLSDVVKTPVGWHLIEVLDKKQEDNTADYVRRLASSQLYNRKYQEAVQDWVLQLRDRAHVEIR